MKQYTVFSLRIANILARQGFAIVGSGVNAKNPKLSVFYFEDTPEFRAALESLTKYKVIKV